MSIFLTYLDFHLQICSRASPVLFSIGSFLLVETNATASKFCKFSNDKNCSQYWHISIIEFTFDHNFWFDFFSLGLSQHTPICVVVCTWETIDFLFPSLFCQFKNAGSLLILLTCPDTRIYLSLELVVASFVTLANKNLLRVENPAVGGNYHSLLSVRVLTGQSWQKLLVLLADNFNQFPVSRELVASILPATLQSAVSYLRRILRGIFNRVDFLVEILPPDFTFKRLKKLSYEFHIPWKLRD